MKTKNNKIGNKKMKIWEEEYLKMGNLENPTIVYLEEGNRKMYMKNGKNYVGKELVKKIYIKNNNNNKEGQ